MSLRRSGPWIGGAAVLASLWALALAGGDRAVDAMRAGEWGPILRLPDHLAGRETPALTAMLRRFLAEATLLFALAALAFRFPAGAARLSARALGLRDPSFLSARVFGLCLFLGSTYVAFRAWYLGGFEGPWYPLAGIMRYQGDPPFQHRLLFVWAANGVHALFPGWAAARCFFVSQFPVFLLTFYAIRKWAELFVPPERAVWSQPLLALMLIPTLGYFTFYDVGVVLFFTAGLFFLFTGRLWTFLGVLVLGTLNHEVTLLLVPVFLVLYRDRMPPRRLLGWLALQLAAYAAVRLALFRALPASEAFSAGKLWTNLHFLTERPGPIVRSLAAVAFWYGAAALGLPRAPDGLRRTLVLLPLLAAMILLVGQVNEPRLWNPFLPAALALLLIGAFGRGPALRAGSPG